MFFIGGSKRIKRVFFFYDIRYLRPQPGTKIVQATQTLVAVFAGNKEIINGTTGIMRVGRGYWDKIFLKIIW